MNKKNTTKMLFMSVDISGSTQFKQSYSASDSDQSWTTAFEKFFREFPLVLVGQTAMSIDDAEEIPSINIWKVIGDEIIFNVKINDEIDTFQIVEAFYRAIVAYDAVFFEKWPLRLKGTCWAVELGQRNIELEIPEMDNSRGAYIDYLGPDVDAGFRLCSHGISGNVILSLELAELLARCTLERGQRFHYVGTAVLKGVLAGKPYPLVFLTFEDLPPDLWRWEAEEDASIKKLRSEPAIEPGDLLSLMTQIRTYVNKSSLLKLTPLSP